MSSSVSGVGISLPQDTSTAAGLHRYARRAARGGVDSFWVQDQVLGTLPRLDPLTTLAAITADRRQEWLGAAVLIAPTRHPVELARTAATLAIMTHGRFICGLGGGSPGVAKRTGLDPATRLARVREAVTVLRLLWSGEPVTYSGQFVQLSDAIVSPTPPSPPPIWLGASTPAALRLSVEVADGWIGAGSATHSEFLTQLSSVREEMATQGRRTVSLSIAKRLYVHITGNRADKHMVEAWFRAYYGRVEPSAAAVTGSADACLEAASSLFEVGVHTVILTPVFPAESQLDALSTDVFPALRKQREALQPDVD